MSYRYFIRRLLIPTIVLSTTHFCGVVVGQETESEPNNTTQIQAAIQSYVAAFNARDVEKLASHWSPDGVYVSRTTGEQSVGRDAIAESFKQTFAGESVPKLAVATDSIEFISPNVALERGSATVVSNEDVVNESNYSVVYVKRDGVWLIDRVTEEELVFEENHFDELQELDWLTGTWQHVGEPFRIEMACQWTTKKNFLSQTFKIFDGEEVRSSGLQIIGWDAKEKVIKSWIFDSDGGVATGTWNKRDDGWAVQAMATLSEGDSGSFTSILRTIDDESFGWEKINQVLAGKLLPNTDEIVFNRD